MTDHAKAIKFFEKMRVPIAIGMQVTPKVHVESHAHSKRIFVSEKYSISIGDSNLLFDEYGLFSGILYRDGFVEGRIG